MSDQIFCAANVALLFDLGDGEPIAIAGYGERQTEDEATVAACHSAAVNLYEQLGLDSLTYAELEECNACDGFAGGSGTVRRIVALYEMRDGAVITRRRSTKAEKIPPEAITSICERIFEDVREERLNQLHQDQRHGFH
jgi:hypothetical protein